MIAVLAAACSRAPAAAIPQAAQAAWLLPGEMPDEPPRAWLGLIGEYDAPTGERLVLEDSGRLYIADTTRHQTSLVPRGSDEFTADPARVAQLLGPRADVVSFGRDAAGRAQWLSIGGTR